MGAFVAFLDATIVNIAVPDMAASFPGASLDDLSWVLNAYNIVFAALLMPAGRLADRWGRRRSFLCGLALFTLASLGCALSGSVGLLTAARVVQAMGSALLVPTSLALLLATYPGARRARAVSLYGAVGAVASGVGPSLGGVFIDLSGWELVFLVNVPVGVIALAVGLCTLTETREPAGRPLPDLIGAVAVGVGVGALSFGLVNGESWGWTHGAVLTAFALTPATALVVVCRGSTHRAPVLDPALLRLRSFAVANVASLIFSTGFFATLLCNVLFLTDVWDYSALRAGLAVSPAPVAAALVALPAGRLAERFGYRPVVSAGTVLFGVGCALYATTVGSTPAFLSEWLPISLLTGIGVGMSLPPLTATALSGVPSDHYAAASAANSTARQIGAVLGITVLVVLTGTPAPSALPAAMDDGWTFATVTTALALVAALALAPVTDPADGAPRTGRTLTDGRA